MHSLRITVVIGGHAFDRAAFDTALQSLPGIEFEYLKHPDAALRMNPRDLQGVDALLLYDIPGIDFRATQDAPRLLAPPAEFQAGFESLLFEGMGIVALHHALAGWPAWPAYGAALGGRFRYRPDREAGAVLPESGYARDIEYGVEVVNAAHPVTQGLPQRFTLCDEPYSCEVDFARIMPLLRADTRYTSAPFESAARALGVRDAVAPGDWPGRAASDVVAWTREVDASRLVYLQPGDGPATYANEHWRRLLGNALHWVARRD